MQNETPRRKPRQARASDTIEKILNATQTILEHEGQSSLNTNRIAKVASVAVGSIYQYFDNKDEIILELLKRQHKRRAQVLKHKLFAMKHRSLEDLVEGLIRALFEFQRENPRLEQILLEKQYSLGLNKLEENYDESFISLLQKYAKLNKVYFNVSDMRLAFKIMVISIKSVSAHLMFDENAPADDVLIKELKEMALRYVK